MAGTTPCWTVERTGLCPCGSGRLVVTQSPGSARPDLCLTPVELAAWKPVSCQALGAGKGDWLQMQLHSRKQSPGGVWGCDTTTAKPELLPQGLRSSVEEELLLPPGLLSLPRQQGWHWDALGRLPGPARCIRDPGSAPLPLLQPVKHFLS